MKKWIGILPLCLLVVVAMYLSFTFHEQAWLFNCPPLIIWIAVVATCQRRWPSLGNPVAVIFGTIYGALAGVGNAAFWMSVATAMLTDRYHRYPYDSTAFAIILLLSLTLFIALAIVDYINFRFKPLLVRIVTALVTFLPWLLTANRIMLYFEGVLSQYVS